MEMEKEMEIGKTVFKLGDASSRDRILIRKERERKRKKRMELQREIDKLLEKVKHIPEITIDIMDEGEISIKDRLVFEQIFKLRDEIYDLSNEQSYLMVADKRGVKQYIKTQNLKQQEGLPNRVVVNTTKEMDQLYTKEYVKQLKEIMTFKECAEHLRCNVDMLRNWYYRRK